MNSKLGNESSEAEYQRYGQEMQELMEETRARIAQRDVPKQFQFRDLNEEPGTRSNLIQ